MAQQYPNNFNNFNRSQPPSQAPENPLPEGLELEPEIPAPAPEAPQESFVPKPIQQIKPINNIPQNAAPSYTPPVPDFAEPLPPLPKKKKSSALAIIVIILAVIIILFLAFLFYYYATKSFVSSPEVTNNPPASQTQQPAQEQEETPAITPTSVIAFAPPETLPAEQKNGNCWTASLTQPYRKDAFRCAVGSVVYDPCFATDQASLVFCQTNPATGNPVVIKVTKALPAVTLPSTIKDNWAWFVKLSDGTICSPITATKIYVNGEQAIYGCTPPDKTTQIVLMGDLTKADRWTANKVVREKQGASWVLKSRDEVEVDTVWQ